MTSLSELEPLPRGAVTEWLYGMAPSAELVCTNYRGQILKAPYGVAMKESVETATCSKSLNINWAIAELVRLTKSCHTKKYYINRSTVDPLFICIVQIRKTSNIKNNKGTK